MLLSFLRYSPGGHETLFEPWGADEPAYVRIVIKLLILLFGWSAHCALWRLLSSVDCFSVLQQFLQRFLRWFVWLLLSFLQSCSNCSTNRRDRCRNRCGNHCKLYRNRSFHISEVSQRYPILYNYGFYRFYNSFYNGFYGG